MEIKDGKVVLRKRPNCPYCYQPHDMQKKLAEKLDEPQFYVLMQEYRHAPMAGPKVTEAFEAMKVFLISQLDPFQAKKDVNG